MAPGDSGAKASGRSRPSVIVIGSGFAGLAAARTLADAGIDVLVLESRDRIGGRAHTDYSLGYPVDLGAAWLHGASLKNPLAPLIGSLRLPLYKTSDDNSVLYDHDLESFVLFTQAGERVPQDVVVKVEAAFEDMLREANKVAAERPHDIDLREAFRIVLESRPDLRLDGLEAEVLQWYICRMEGWFATDLEELSARNWGEEKLIEGGHGLMIDGYAAVLQTLARGLRIRTNQRVVSLHCFPKGAMIKTAQGETYSANAVIVTLPIGVLKAGSVQFHPPLPPAKQEAVRSMGAGIENKVALLFSSIFWPSVEFLGAVGPTSYDCGYFLNLHKATGAPVLVYMPAGQLARDMERMSDEEAVAFTMQQLRRILPQATDPVKSVVTRWASDPSSLCAYSFDRVGVPMEAHDALRAPVGSCLFFAGEATSRDYPGTVHGAFETGTMAARECWEALSCQNLLPPESVLEVAPAISASVMRPTPVIMSRL